PRGRRRSRDRLVEPPHRPPSHAAPALRGAPLLGRPRRASLAGRRLALACLPGPLSPVALPLTLASPHRTTRGPGHEPECSQTREGAPSRGAPSTGIPAATYSPRGSPPTYHRRGRA